MTQLSPPMPQKYDQVYENSTLHLVEGADHSFTDTYQRTAADLTAEFLQDSNTLIISKKRNRHRSLFFMLQ